MEEVLWETRSRVRVGSEVEDSFWTEKRATEPASFQPFVSGYGRGNGKSEMERGNYKKKKDI